MAKATSDRRGAPFFYPPCEAAIAVPGLIVRQVSEESRAQLLSIPKVAIKK